MNHRWEFVVRLSGWGAGPQEAWRNVVESLIEDGVGDCPDELDRLDAKAVREANKRGRDYAFRMEPDTRCPEGALTVWEPSPMKKKTSR